MLKIRAYYEKGAGLNIFARVLQYEPMMEERTGNWRRRRRWRWPSAETMDVWLGSGNYRAFPSFKCMKVAEESGEPVMDMHPSDHIIYILTK